MDFGSYGPKELVLYGGITAGVIVGSVATAKGMTKIQEYLDHDFDERRPLKWPVQKITEYLSEEKDEIQQGFELLFEEEDED